ncbi:MAG: bifunctional 2-polyprenyl-6-hydroxyphenol methylase/3-demethylubiquinol 3-O-methyltransferase UbiG [Alphaproteobacteria bacterium]|nr:bifunctional 2-polyprenyl-6-hydroxyphenol methylase/3-demethylubiquinol 3-O-methyltransferase UbiG [Alphaproteobacteria bacterium]
MKKKIFHFDGQSQVLSGTIDHEEVEKFSSMAESWWDPKGSFAPLHKINPIRIAFLRDQLIHKFKLDPSHPQPLKDLKILDIGCGGGLLCEPLTRLGAYVTGIDASPKNISIATQHAENNKLSIRYYATSVEEFVKNNEKFDVIVAMEIVEHVANLDLFLSTTVKLMENKGCLALSTLNRTVKSFLYAIIGAEYILQWLPKGTHDWQKFLTPAELIRILEKNKLSITTIKGMSYNPFQTMWSLSSDIKVNYFLFAEA